MTTMGWRSSIAASCLAALAASPAIAFKLQAFGMPGDALPQDRQARGFLLLFTSDVHERITRQAYDAAGVKLTGDVIAGVRWNDNPPALRLGALFGACNARGMRIDEDVGCWASMLRLDRFAWETLSRREKGIAPLRSHFGDMQFLHAMAAREGEEAQDTRTKSLHWAEFAYRVARGEIAPRANVHALRDSRVLEPATRMWISDLFGAPEKRLWTVQDIFLPKGANLRLVAFGTLLHLVEDSYSAAHVVRASSRRQPNGCPSYDGAAEILEFHTYVGQDTEKHALCDDAPDWLDSPRAGSPTDVAAQLVRAYADGAGWHAVKTILEEKVFRLSASASAARPGRCFERKLGDPDAPATARPVALDPECGRDPRGASQR